MRSKVLAAAVICTVLGAVAGTAVVSASTKRLAPISSKQVLHFKEKTTRFVPIVDIEPAGPSAGDGIAITSIFLDNGKIVGRNAVTCTFPNRKVAYCDGTGKLAGGEIASPPASPSPPSPLAGWRSSPSRGGAATTRTCTGMGWSSPSARR